MEYELKKNELQANMTSVSDGSAVTGSGKQPDLFKLMPHFEGKGDISIYLSLFERQISRMNIVKENWVTHLLSLNPLEIANVISREPETLTNDYDYEKNLLLKRFKMMPEEFRQKLMSHKKEYSATWRDLASELKNYLEEWIGGLGVSNFEALKELIVVDQIRRRLPIEMKEHFIGDLPKIKNVEVLVNKLEDYESARRSIKTMNRNSHQFEDRKLKLRENSNTKPWLSAQSYDNLRKQQYANNSSQNPQLFDHKEVNYAVIEAKNSAKPDCMIDMDINGKRHIFFLYWK